MHYQQCLKKNHLKAIHADIVILMELHSFQDHIGLSKSNYNIGNKIEELLYVSFLCSIDRMLLRLINFHMLLILRLCYTTACHILDLSNSVPVLIRKMSLQAFSTVGTSDYIAPEVLLRKGYGLECDW